MPKASAARVLFSCFSCNTLSMCFFSTSERITSVPSAVIEVEDAPRMFSGKPSMEMLLPVLNIIIGKYGNIVKLIHELGLWQLFNVARTSVRLQPMRTKVRTTTATLKFLNLYLRISFYRVLDNAMQRGKIPFLKLS